MKTKLLLIFLLSCQLFGCGFHLRGLDENRNAANLKNAQVYLTVTNENRVFHRQLKRDLQLTEVRLVEDIKNANWHLVILLVDTEKKSVGIDRKGRSNEYTVSMKVEFIIVSREMLNENGDSNSENDSNLVFRISRNVYSDNNDQIGQRKEENNILDTMRKELSRRLINALSLRIVKQ